MQTQKMIDKIKLAIDNFQSTYKLSTCFVLLLFFLVMVIFVSFIIPFLDFGRFLGTDDYSHIVYTQEMDASNGINSFYSQMGVQANDPENPQNAYNYPFGLWLFGSFISKITGLTVMTGNFIVVILLLFLIIGTFYLYSGLFLTTKEQKIIAVLFMISMPNVAMILLNYRPSVFMLPFLFTVLFLSLQETTDWKLFPLIWLSIFIITVSHTGTFMFLISCSLIFFLLYSLIWGKFAKYVYFTIVSTFFIYIGVLNWFPQISNQYEVKSTLFLSPGNFLASKFNFVLIQDLSKIFYQNFFVGQQLIYAILFVVALFGASQVLIYIHRRISIILSGKTILPAFVIPIQNISHSALASPIWLGPLHILLSVPGIFRLSQKGKCLFITVIFTTLLPDLLHTSEGIEVATGALREISFLIVIIPVTAALGFIWLISYLKKMKNPYRTPVTFFVWIFVLSAVILTPAISTTYYLPKIAGEDNSINGMKWLGENGQIYEKVTGYGIRTVPVFTNMSSPLLEEGSETRSFIQSLKSIYFSSNEQENTINNFRQIFDVKYILLSDKILANFGGTPTNLRIDSNQGLDKIYSSMDFGIYEITTSKGNSFSEYTIADNTTIQKLGSSFEVNSPYYTADVKEDTPILERYGTKQKNFFGSGFFSEQIVVSKDIYALSNMQFSHEIKDNQIIYRTSLNGPDSKEASLVVRYTFYPEVIKREYILSNDKIVSNKSSLLNMQFSSSLFSPLSNYIITNNKEQQLRKIYESQDAVEKTIKVEDIFIFNSDDLNKNEKQGIRIKFVPSSPLPSTVYYKGSTLYNMSSVTISQTNSILPGKTLSITQFLSTGDEYGTEKKILSQNGIQLNKYPDGIDPIIVFGLGPSFSDAGYSIVKKYGIPYSQIIRSPSGVGNSNETENTTETSDILGDTDISEIDQSSPQNIQIGDLEKLTSNSIGIIGSASMANRNYNNITTQQKTIELLEEYAKNQSIPLNGFMPFSFRYNLDTIKILNDNGISFMLSNQINSNTNEGYRNPQLAYYNGEPTNLVLIPVSYPASSSLNYQEDPSEIFSQWRNIINNTADNDEIIVLFLNSADIGDPEYSEEFMNLFSFAQQKGYTFTSPDLIANHYRQLQNIEFTGYTDMDVASINVTNNNDKTVEKLTFKVELDALNPGNYTSNQGRIVKTEKINDTEFMYINTDIPAHTTQNLIIKPDLARKPLQVQFPEFLSEGSMVINVKDMEGRPIKNAEIILDTNFYRTDKDGKVNVNVPRGTHSVLIQSPGYEKYSKTIEVKGRLVNLLHFLNLVNN
jgi:hypothetical protein